MVTRRFTILLTVLLCGLPAVATAQSAFQKAFQKAQAKQNDANATANEPADNVADNSESNPASNDVQTERPPFSAMVIQTTPTVGNAPAMMTDELVTVVQVKQSESLVVDESGRRRWVVNDTIEPIQQSIDRALATLEQNPQDATSLYRMAAILYKQGSYLQALQYSDKLLKHAPNHVHLYPNRSQIFTSLKRYDDAIQACTAGLNQNPKSSILYVNRGLAYLRQGKLDLALADCDQAIEIGDNIMAMNNRAVIFSQQNRLEKALEQYASALAIGEADFLFRGQGGVHEKLGNHQQAMKSFSDAIDANPGDVENHLARARFLFRRKQFSPALKDFKTAAALSPTDASVLTDVGVTLAAMGDTDEGLTLLDKAIAIAPDDALALANKAYLILKKGNADAALAIAEQAVQADPTLPLAHSNKATILGRLGRDTEAVDAYTAAIGQAPQNLGYRNDRGISYLRLEQLDRAQSDFEYCVDKAPNNAIYTTNLSRVFERTGDLAKAIELLTTAIGLNPKYDIAYYRRGILYLTTGDAQKATTDLQQAVGLDPNWPLAWFHLARAHTDNNDLKAAVQAYGRSLKLNDQNTACYVNRSFVHLRLGQYDLAKADAEKAIQLDPLDNDATYNLATALYYLDQCDQAALQYSVVIGAGVASTKIFNSRGDCYQELGRYEDAAADYSRSLAIQADSPGVLHARGYCLTRVGRGSDALADFDKSLSLDPKRLSTRLMRGHLHRGSGQYQRAADDYQKVLEQEPDSVPAMVNLAAVLAAAEDEKVRDGARAIEIAMRACEQTDHKSTLPLSVLALAFAQSGDYDKAIEAGTQALQLQSTTNQGVPPWLLPAIERFKQKQAWRLSATPLQ
ncbi:MAG: tetratricopeptide repeat protein [Pirellulaceae bacterium]|nr:tetratricopeptide repeat protein [Pirellulaceae bacterium]